MTTDSGFMTSFTCAVLSLVYKLQLQFHFHARSRGPFMSKLLFLCAASAAAFAFLFRHYHHASAFHRLVALAVVSGVLALLRLRRHPVSHFLEDMRHLAD